MKVIYVDIDETIIIVKHQGLGTTHDYAKAKPIVENIEKINKQMMKETLLCIGLLV